MTDKTLLLNQEQVDEYLLQIGLTDIILADVRGIMDDKERLIIAGKYFSSIGKFDFSFSELSMLVASEWAGMGSNRGLIDMLASSYREKQEHVRQTQGFEVPLIHLLREDTGNYSGNYLESLTVWPEVEFSDEDLRRSIRLPLGLNKEIAQFIGMIWADGNIQRSSGASRLNVIQLGGDPPQKEMYTEFIQPMLKKHFNYDSTLYLLKATRSCLIDIGSFAITSWVFDQLGIKIEGGRVKRTIPYWLFESGEDIIEGFVEGVIAKRGIINPDPLSIQFSVTSKSFRESLYHLFSERNYSVSIRENWKVAIHAESTREVLFESELLNYEHRHFAEEYKIRHIMGKEKLLSIWYDVLAGRRSRFPHFALNQDENRMVLIDALLEKYRREVDPIGYPRRPYFEQNKLLGLFKSLGDNTRKVYTFAGILDQQSNRYDPCAAGKLGLV
ncbi:MAG: hypothetical protein ABIJ34_04520 [archaeon]